MNIIYNLINFTIQNGSLYFLIKSKVMDNDIIYKNLQLLNNEQHLKIYNIIINNTIITDDIYIMIKTHQFLLSKIEVDKILMFKEMIPLNIINDKIIKSLLKYFSIIYNTSYWYIVKDLYYNYIVNNDILYYSVNTYYNLYKYFPNNIIKLNSNYKNLYKLSNLYIAYYLGYNISINVPTTLYLLNILYNFDMDKHFDNIIVTNKSYILNYANIYNLKIANPMNDDNDYINSLYENIYTYNLYDINFIQHNNLLYIYTIDEFDYLTNNKCHFTNRYIIDDFIINDIKHKYKLFNNKIYIGNMYSKFNKL